MDVHSERIAGYPVIKIGVYMEYKESIKVSEISCFTAKFIGHPIEGTSQSCTCQRDKEDSFAGHNNSIPLNSKYMRNSKMSK